jgi:hypothetical protein
MRAHTFKKITVGTFAKKLAVFAFMNEQVAIVAVVSFM